MNNLYNQVVKTIGYDGLEKRAIYLKNEIFEAEVIYDGYYYKIHRFANTSGEIREGISGELWIARRLVLVKFCVDCGINEIDYIKNLAEQFLALPNKTITELIKK